MGQETVHIKPSAKQGSIITSMNRFFSDEQHIQKDLLTHYVLNLKDHSEDREFLNTLEKFAGKYMLMIEDPDPFNRSKNDDISGYRNISACCILHAFERSGFVCSSQSVIFGLFANHII